MQDAEILFVTEVGSRMWGMEKFASDYDLFHCYQQPAGEYLRTSTFEKSRPAKTFTADAEYLTIPIGAEIDAQYMEIGHLVNLLKKGNINAIWAVCSGVIRRDNPALKELRGITLNNLSKATYQSIKGMALSAYADADIRKAVRDPEKSLWTCRRTLEMGDSLLLGGGVDFFVVTRMSHGSITKEYCQEAFAKLERSYALSKLPDFPDPVPFDDFLFRIRMKEILDNNIFVKVK